MTEDEIRAYQQRQEQEEAPLIKAFLAWIAALRAVATVEEVSSALASGSARALLDLLRRIRIPSLRLAETGALEGTHAVGQLPDPHRLELRFDVHDPNFHIAVERQGLRDIREIDDTTRQAISRIISEAYRNGWHPRTFAPAIQQTIGLTSKQTVAVTNLYRARAAVAGEARALAEAERYATRLRRQRAMTIARTETIAAAIIGRIAGFEQAAQHGLFDRSRAWLEWNAIQQDPSEICFQLDGKRVRLGSTFDGYLPPAHPNCRCVVDLVIE